MAKWICNMCGRQIESDVKPAHCPCGSEKVNQKEEKSKLERFIGKILG